MRLLVGMVADIGLEGKRARRLALMKICIVSDSHDRSDALERAINDAAAEGAQVVVHCGDVIGAHTLRPALRAGLPMHVIHGNNLGDSVALHKLSQSSGGLLQYHGPDARLELGGRKIFLVHYPEYGHALACTGNWDLVCCGHSHQAGIDRVATVKGGSTWLVNPGTIAGLAAPATWILGDLAAMHFDLHTLAL
jgi:uncharacterized protein